MATELTAQQGFDSAYYLEAKAAALTLSTGQTWTAAQVEIAFAQAGLSPSQHYLLYGYNEGLAPNAYFNKDTYAASKAAASGQTILEFMNAWQAYSGTNNLFLHYVQFGAFENDVNPSTGFNDQLYYQAKADALGGGTTWEQARSAIQAAGMNAISHWLLYGHNENLNYTPTPAPVVGQTYTLTTNVDVLTGTAGDDTFVGINTTLTTGDNLNGAAGTDTLQATFGAAANPLVTLKSIEHVEFTSALTALTGGAAPMNTGNWTGVEKLSVFGLGQAVTDSTIAGAGNAFVGLQNNVTIGAKNMTVGVDNDAVMAVQFGADKLGSTTATLSLEVEDIVGNTALTGEANILVDTQGTDKITMLNISSTGTNRVQLKGAAASEISLTNITATGAGNLSFSVDATNAIITSLANVDASKATGKFAANLAASTKNVTFLGSAGANTVTFGNGDNTITGGAAGDTFTIGTGKNTVTALAGNDTVITALADLTTHDVIDLGEGTRDAIMYNNVTKINSTGIDATALTALNAQKNVEVVGSSAAVTAIDFGYLTQNVIRLSGNLTAAVTGTNVDGDTLEFTGNGITGVNADALTVSGVLPNRTLTLELNGAAGVNLAGTNEGAGNTGLTVSSGISTINILSTTSATSTTGITNSINVGAVGPATHAIDNVSAGTFVLTGNVDFTVGTGATAGFTNQVDFNASQFTGKLTIAGSAGADVITGGTGNDIITALGGDDTIALTAGGVDKLVFSTAATNGKDTITGFTGSSAAGADSINIALLGDTTLTTIEKTITSAAAQEAWADDRAYIIDTTGAAGNLTTGGAAAVTDFTNLTQVAAYLAERFTIAAGEDGAIVLNSIASGSTTSYVYNVLDADNAFNAADLTLVGVIDRGTTTLISSNVVFA